MAEKRRGLGRGIEALIPTSKSGERPADIFFPRGKVSRETAENRTPAVRGSVRNSAEEQNGTQATVRETAVVQAVGNRSANIANKTKPKQTTATAASGQKDADSPKAPRNSKLSTKAKASTGKAATASDKNDVKKSRTENNSTATDQQETTGVKPITAHTAGSEKPGKQNTQPSRTDSAESDTQEQASFNDTQLKPIDGLAAGEINVDDIAPNPQQPRTIFDEEELEELAASIREVGLLQPIVVRPAIPGSEKPFELIMGERRWRASQLAGLEMIPAIIRSTDDEDLLRDALLENLHRANLNPLEEASAYQQLLEDFNCTHDELARRIARSRPQISNTLRLLKLPPLVQRRVAAGVLSAGHARALLGLTDPGAMERLAQRIVAEGLSVRAVEEIIALGDEPVAPEQRRRRIANPVAPALDELATRLADRFDTRVKVAMGARKGRITVEFAGLEDLDRILAVLAPGEQAPGDESSTH